MEFEYFDISTARFSNYALVIDDENTKWFVDHNSHGILMYDDNNFKSFVPTNYNSAWGEP